MERIKMNFLIFNLILILTTNNILLDQVFFIKMTHIYIQRSYREKMCQHDYNLNDLKKIATKKQSLV